MIIGSEPPSSSVTRLVPLAHSAMICSPTGVEPVKAILRTSGWVTSALPAFEPPPVTTLNTPGGSPPSCRSSAKRSVVSGVVPAGLATTVLPATSAGASLLDSSVVGKFHGHDRADDAERPAQHDAVDAGIEVRRVHAAQRLREARRSASACRTPW